MKYVIGNNAVSYFVSFFLDIPLIKHKTLEKLDRNIGKELIPINLLNVSKQFFDDCKILEYERSYDDRGKFTSNRPKNFYKLYCLYTRGKTTVEHSYLSQLEKYQKYVSINGNGPENSFNLLLEKVQKIVNKTCIDKPINSIDIEGEIVFDDGSIGFNNIISTINIIDLAELDKTGKIKKSIISNNNLDGFHLPHNDRFTYICSLDSSEDKILSGIYKEVLATGKPYFRKTYIDNKIIYDCMRNIYNEKIEDNNVIEYAESTQMSDNINMKKVMGIDLIGKFSQWSENTNLNTVYIDCLELKEFYNSEKNHKKIF
tara:strand:+ start:1187 stop:2131 length:945 start_codon:yes stop_codon:yes gene_type:complete